ncbi:MAG: anhydro-N-acetylmuramic acid kinase [Gemmataceae bacterium]
MPPRWLIGLASGSSGDGVDAALMELEGVGLELRVRHVQGLHQPYGQELRALIRRVSASAPCEIRQVSLLHRLLGETFAAAARTVADHASLSLQRVQCIGCPGHTIWHDSEGRFPSTLALGMAAVIAERCGVTTISDFRSRDVAAGGQGVPLAALTDYLLFRHPHETRLLIHLGGLARVVFVPGNCRIHEVLGFEASPCNVLLDALMGHLTGGKASFDPGGKHAVQGKCIDALLQNWLHHPYLQRRPPKSLPRHLFGDDFATAAVQQVRQTGGSLHDLLCTATHFVARGITTAIKRFLPSDQRIDRILLSGGGVRNGLLWRLLEQPFEGVPLQRTDEVGVPADVRKALSFGMLAALTLDGVPASVPSATGAAGSRLLGSITPGSSSNWARCLAWMAAQTTPPFCPEI